ncbi:MAG: DUF1326 domain-containing protein [candidate division NC10 bacterium]
MAAAERWWAKGLLFENCNCQLLCPAHLSFKQRCEHERCVGHWAIHIDQGSSGTLALDGLNAFIINNSPQLMISGEWTQAIYIDQRAGQAERGALERIFTGQAGGSWAVLARFVSTRLPTRFVPIHFKDEGRRKAMWIDDCLETAVEAIKSADPAQEAILANVFNQIHASTQVLALGATRFADRGLALATSGTHALYSRFAWAGP